MLGRFAATVAVTAALVAGCKAKAKGAGTGSGAGDSAETACAGAEREGGALHWFRDSYGKALACARAKHVPLAIDMWAPWCHTCLSMQAYVLTDARLADYDRRFVFLSLDTDREANAAPVAKFPPAAWPTFFVVSSDEAIQSRFVGAASAEQFAAFLDQGERGAQASAGVPLSKADASARAGDQAFAKKDWVAADEAYQAALAAAPPGWVRRPDVLVSLIGAKTRHDDWDGCASLALDHINDTGSAASASDFTYHVLECADAVEKADPPDPARAKQLREAVVTRLTALTADASAPLSVDDRSDALMYLREALDALGKKDEAKQAAQRQRAILDEAAAKAPSPQVASTYNWPRSEVYVYLAIPADLIPALTQSAKDLPDEYDPPYRLAYVQWKAGMLDAAEASAKRAVSMIYGPRKTRALAMLADIRKARGDTAGEREARLEIVTTWEKLPPDLQNPDALRKARADLVSDPAPEDFVTPDDPGPIDFSGT